MNENETGDGKIEASLHTPFTEKLSNFWYHYKWHTLIALFVAIAVTVTAVQLIRREREDISVMYAGGYQIGRSSSGGIPPYETVKSSLGRAVGDLDGDGKTNVALLDLFLLTTREIEDYVPEEGKELNLRLLADNTEVFSQNLLYSEYYLCFLSTSIYEENKIAQGVPMFVPLADYAGDNEDLRYYAPDAIYLSSTPLGAAAGFSDFPPDTVIVLRTLSAVASHFNKKDNERAYGAAQEALRRILAAE